MTEPENRTESFVVRVWLERREIADAPPVWRGVVEHVASGRRRYIRELDAVVNFMAEYMRDWGVRPTSWMVLSQQLSQTVGKLGAWVGQFFGARVRS